MPDPILILEALALAAGSAAAAVLLTRWPWRIIPPSRTAISALAGVLLGIFLGCWWLGLLPNWPPREDQDRLLLLLLPAVAVVEGAGAFAVQRQWPIWVLRLLIAALAARLLLHGSVYVSDAMDSESTKWTATQSWLILTSLGAALAFSWLWLSRLLQKSHGLSIPLAVASACGAASIAVMLSGYATGGQIGLPVAAALAGAAAASFGLTNRPLVYGLLGVGLAGLFGLVIIGRFFGQLATVNAVLLFTAPLLCGTSEMPVFRRLKPRLRGIARIGLTAVPAGIALFLAYQQFQHNSVPTPTVDSNVPQPTIEDYMNFGK
jgi:hypothetical protein